MNCNIDKIKYLKRVIIASWVALAVCFVIKMFGGNLFEIICNNEAFIKVCEYKDTHLWLDYIMSGLYCFVSVYFFTLAILQRNRYKIWELILVIITVLGGTAIKIWCFEYGIIFDIWQVILLPAILIGKDWKSYWKIILANVLLILFQVISMFTKGTTPQEIYNNSIIGMIYSFDVLIMTLLYYGYANLIKSKKGVKDNE